MNYGLPYQGSKNKIAWEVLDNIPTAENLYDLFAGGCAITDVAIRSQRFRNIIANDITDAPSLFVDAINGKYKDERRWISREDFYALKDTDAYVRICWSFGNNGSGYMYSREIEPWKKALHYARVLGDSSLLAEFGIESDGSRADILRHHDEYKERYIRWWLSHQEYSAEELDALIATTKDDIAKTEEELRQYLLEALKDSGLTQAEVGKRLGTQMQGHYFGRSQWAFPTKEYYEQMQTFMPKLDQDYNNIVGLYNLQQSLQSLERLQSLESLERLQRLQRLQSLQSLQRVRGSYQDVEITDNSVIYCDIPYRDTADYGTEFDHEDFYEWVRAQRQLVIVSEYSMPEDFVCVWRTTMMRKFSASAHNVCPEGLYVHKAQLPLYNAMMNRLF